MTEQRKPAPQTENTREWGYGCFPTIALFLTIPFPDLNAKIIASIILNSALKESGAQILKKYYQITSTFDGRFSTLSLRRKSQVSISAQAMAAFQSFHKTLLRGGFSSQDQSGEQKSGDPFVYRLELHPPEEESPHR